MIVLTISNNKLLLLEIPTYCKTIYSNNLQIIPFKGYSEKEAISNYFFCSNSDLNHKVTFTHKNNSVQ